jgi:DivIVA domain-containing protein
MDLSPEVINEVEFSMARRGYDPDQVDEFLEKVAVAVGELGERLTEARERALTADRRANEIERKLSERPERATDAAAASVSAQAEAELETLKRTLVLAQRTADAAMREAEQEAARIRADAATEAANLVRSAEGEARAAHEDTLRALLEEIAALESGRDTLRDDVLALERHLDEQRLRLRGAISELQRIVDDPSGLKAAPVPVDLAPASAPPVEEEAEAPEPDPDPAAAARPKPFVAELADEPERDATGSNDDGHEGFESLGLTLDDADDDAWARFSAPDDDLDAGPPTQPVLHLDDLAVRAADDDDAYLAELRKAMLEDTGAPDVDDDLQLDEDAERPPRSRFGRRR